MKIIRNEAVRESNAGAFGRRIRILGLVGLVLAGLTAMSIPVPPAQALDLDLPTWEDVQKAKKNESAGAAKVTEIEGLIEQVEDEVERTRAESEAATTALAVAEQELFEAQQRTESLEAEAKKSAKQADRATREASTLVSQMYRSGGVDRSVELFLEADGSTADGLLDRLGQMTKATERNQVVADEASKAKNTATALADQAETAREERDKLREAAEARKIEAAEAAAAASEKLAKNEEQLEVLETQLEALKDKTTDTVAGYEERLRKEEEERKRLERAARREAKRQAAAAAAAAAAANNGGGGGGGSSTPGRAPSGGGGGSVNVPAGSWITPIARGSYSISDWWGADRSAYGFSGHTGVDFAAPAWTPIRAVASGTVTMSGWYAPCYANMVEVTHGGGLATRYAHMVSTPPVSVGQRVRAGDVIGYVGTTGCSTGNHTHFETYTYGYPVNPVPIMAARGVSL